MDVGSLAGIIWETLDKNGKLSATALAKESGLKKDEAMLAMGWLCREDKILMEKVGNATKFSLK